MALFDEEDQNEDGYVGRVEAKGSVDLQARFMDIDRDGQLSGQKMRDWIAKPNKRDLLRVSAHRAAQREAEGEQARELERR
ncbi:MAG: hypothetical protein ACREV9_13535 [Burkholderiales bacterium]